VAVCAHCELEITDPTTQVVMPTCVLLRELFGGDGAARVWLGCSDRNERR
jgi:hypothetical protein